MTRLQARLNTRAFQLPSAGLVLGLFDPASAMAPRPTETHVSSLQPAFDISRSNGQQSGVDLREERLPQNSLQGCFALEGSSAAHHLGRRHWASTAMESRCVLGQLSATTQP